MHCLFNRIFKRKVENLNRFLSESCIYSVPFHVKTPTKLNRFQFLPRLHLLPPLKHFWWKDNFWPDVRLVGKPHWIRWRPHHRAKMVENQPLKGLREIRGQGCRPVAAEVLGMGGLWYRYHTRGLPQPWCFPQLQAQIEQISQDAVKFSCAAPHEPGADSIWSCSLPHLDLSPLFPHLKCWKGQDGSWGRGMNVGVLRNRWCVSWLGANRCEVLRWRTGKAFHWFG